MYKNKGKLDQKLSQTWKKVYRHPYQMIFQKKERGGQYAYSVLVAGTGSELWASCQMEQEHISMGGVSCPKGKVETSTFTVFPRRVSAARKSWRWRAGHRSRSMEMGPYHGTGMGGNGTHTPLTTWAGQDSHQSSGKRRTYFKILCYLFCDIRETFISRVSGMEIMHSWNTLELCRTL